MIIGIMPEQGGSLKNLQLSGQLDRFIDYYLKPYSNAFEEVYYFSYSRDNFGLPLNCKIVGNKYGIHRWFYAFLMPFLHRRYIKKCDCFRVMQITGVLPAVISGFLYGRKFAATYGYHYEDILKIRKLFFRIFNFRLLEWLGFKASFKIFTTSASLIEYIKKRGCSNSKIALLPNSVDTDLFRPDCSAFKAESIIYVGRLSAEKNLLLLIQAMAEIRAKFMDMKLTCIGEGEQKNALSAYASSKGVNIEFRGVLSHQDIPGHLNRSHLFILPSVTEGHPKTLLEAMSCGLACLGNNIAGINEIIEDGHNGLLFNGSLSDLRAKMELLLSDRHYARELGKNARDSVLKKYDMRKNIAQEIGVLKNL